MFTQDEDKITLQPTGVDAHSISKEWMSLKAKRCLLSLMRFIGLLAAKQTLALIEKDHTWSRGAFIVLWDLEAVDDLLTTFQIEFE